MVSTPAWVTDRVESLVDSVRSVELGEGSNRPASSTLYRAAYALGQYVPHLLGRDQVERRLLHVATVERAEPMRPGDAERTVANGLEAGMRDPWHPRPATRSPAKTKAKMATTSSPRRPTSSSKGPPDPDEVMSLWTRCRPVLDDREVAAWLESKSIEPVRVDDANLARALPRGRVLPAWARSKEVGGAWQTWAESGHRLVLPLVDVEGNLRSVLARDVTGARREKKSLSPLGHTRRGFFLRDSAARVALWPDSVVDPVPELAGPERWHDDAPERRFVVVEGEKKFLMHATLGSDAGQHHAATIAIFSGAWTDELAALIPAGWTVRIAVDPDGCAEAHPGGPAPSGGLLYATKIMRSLERRHRAHELRVKWGREFALGYDDRQRLVFRLADGVAA